MSRRTQPRSSAADTALADIVFRRFILWEAGMVEQRATPILAVGVVHGDPGGSRAILLTCEDVPESQIEQIVEDVLRCIKEGRVKR